MIENKKLIDRVKSRGTGEFLLQVNDQFGPEGPQAGDLGYVMWPEETSGDFGDGVETFYRVFFEGRPSWHICFDSMGEYRPYQEALF